MRFNIVQCPECGGTGRIELGRNRVTRGMALDAGNRELEGQDCGPILDTCPRCHGDGTLEEDDEQAQD